MKLHLPAKLKAALLTAVLAAGSYPAFGVTSDTTAYTPSGEGAVSITFNGAIWTWNNVGDGTKLSAATSVYTNYGTGETKNGNDSVDAGTFYSYFFNTAESNYVGNTLRFSGASSDIRLNTDWTNYVWVGGIITEASENDITYTLGRDGTTTFKLTGTSDVNLLLNSNFTLLTQSSGGYSVAVEKGGTWTVASGKTFTISTGSTTLAADQSVTINGGGTVAINSSLTTNSGASIDIASGTTVNVSGTVTNGGELDISGNMELEGAVSNTGTITVNSGGSLTIGQEIDNTSGSVILNGTLKLASDLNLRTYGELSYSEGDNGYVTGRFYLISGGTTTIGDTAQFQLSDGTSIGYSQLEDGSIVSGSIANNSLYYQNTGDKTFANVSSLPYALYIAEGASVEISSIVDATISHVSGSGTLKVHLNDTQRTFNLSEFNGTLHVEGSASARGLLYTGSVNGDNVTIELGTRGQIVMTNNHTFSNDIIIDSNIDTNVTDDLACRIYANSGQSGTLTGNITLNGKTLYKQGGGTLSIIGDTAVNSLLSGSEGSTFSMTASGTVQIGGNAYTASGDNFTTNLVVNNSTLNIATAQNSTKTFIGSLTLNDSASLNQMDGGSLFTGAISLGAAGNVINLSANWGKGGIELAGQITGAGNVYMTGGANIDNSAAKNYQTLNISGTDNAFTGTYIIGANSEGTASRTNVRLIAGTETSLAHATVNLAGGDKAELFLATGAATVAGLDGTAGSSISTAQADGATLTVNGGGTYAGSFADNVGLTKQGAASTLTLAASTLNNTINVEGGTLSLTAADLTLGDAASITVQSGNEAKLVYGANQGITVTALAPAASTASTLAARSSSPATVTKDSIRNADITVTAEDAITQRVSDSNITNETTTELAVEVGDTLGTVYAHLGDITLLTGDVDTLTATQVHIGGGMTVGVYQGSKDAPGDMAGLPLDSLLTDATATLNANVTVEGSLTLGGLLTMGSGSVLLNGATISLGDSFAATITGEGEYTLINGIVEDGLSYENALLDTSNLSGSYSYSLGSVVGDNGTSLVLTARLLPEPSTATLSLLALAALVARRRRK